MVINELFVVISMGYMVVSLVVMMLIFGDVRWCLRMSMRMMINVLSVVLTSWWDSGVSKLRVEGFVRSSD